MRFLRLHLYFLMLLVFLTSCKSKKSIAVNQPTKSKTESETKPTGNIVSKEETTSEEGPVKISREEIKTETKNISDKTLVNFISDWYGTTYKYGGSDKHGIDCSHFTAK